jgi:biotin operon repressor
MTAEEKIVRMLYISPTHVSSLELQGLTGLNDRTVRKLIENMRNDGACILSDSKGYYFPKSEGDLVTYIKKTEKAARSLFKSLRSAKKMLRDMQHSQQDRFIV